MATSRIRVTVKVSTWRATSAIHMMAFALRLLQCRPWVARAGLWAWAVAWWALRCALRVVPR